MSRLERRVAVDLSAPLPHTVEDFARHLGDDANAAAVLFYGSVLRTGKLDELLDFYVLTDGDARAPLIWPSISFRAFPIDGGVIRAKVATMPLSLFDEGARGHRLDTTIWTRFCQPCALAFARDAAAADAVTSAVAAAIVTAARYAAVLGPRAATAGAFWTALFERTYQTELRVEAPGRSATIVAHAPARYAELLPLAWAETGIPYARQGEAVAPQVPRARAAALRRAWRRRTALGKPLNVLRLLKAALTLRDAAGYALWKIERHTGVHIEQTRWRLAHPLLATPGVLWQLARARARQRQEQPS